MSDTPQHVWDLAKVIHEARDKLCWGNHLSESRHHWPGPEVTPHNYGHNPQPWVDIALAQAKAVLKHQKAIAAIRAMDREKAETQGCEKVGFEEIGKRNWTPRT